ncbi:MAG: hypothetical protein KatS3mg115_2340 [Candidatus Poribacteria bacterium]|nr:MAG: hypothetical protein KatS3mg115_2340 [Candidatus Poribacteria bacterium]
MIAGFEPLDVLQGLVMLMRQRVEGRAEVENEYYRIVRPEGNRRALEILYRVFEPADTEWRGLGVIPNSGLRLRPEYARFDAAVRLPVEREPLKVHRGCICGDILRGAKRPDECPLFGKACDPEHPIGPCMVSSEGTCAAYFRYGPPKRSATARPERSVHAAG